MISILTHVLHLASCDRVLSSFAPRKNEKTLLSLSERRQLFSLRYLSTHFARSAMAMTLFTVPFAAFFLAPIAIADEPSLSDVIYGSIGDVALRLDFYEPTQRGQERPLIVWVHGGAWRSGTKSGVPIVKLREQGFAIASVDYRLSPVAKFPAQIHDIKSAIRFLRANADRYGVDANRFVLAGSSAGGHLAVLAAVSDGVSELIGNPGVAENISSSVQAVVSFYGAGNIQTILSQSTPFGLGVRVPALELFLGGQPDQQPTLARLASPVVHIDSRDPPLWLYHGDQDPQMPINQSHELEGAYKKIGLPVKLEVVHGGKHGGAGFFTDEQLSRLGKELLDSLQH